MPRKIALFAFNGEAACFAHALLNALDLNEKGHDVKLVIEGQSTQLVRDMAKEGAPFFGLYRKVQAAGLLDCVCKACAAKMGSLDSAETQGLPLCDEMSGHPAMARYIEAGYEIITF